MDLSESRSKDDFLNRIRRKSHSELSVEFARTCHDVFEKYCKEKLHSDGDNVIHTLLAKQESARKEGITSNSVYTFLDNYVNWLDSDYTPRHFAKLSPTTIRHYYDYLAKYLRYCGLSIDPITLKNFVALPKMFKEQPIPIELKHIITLVENADKLRKALYLTLISSGIRIGEATQLRKRDLDFDSDPVSITLPAVITKSKQTRETFISTEAKERLIPIMKRLKPDDRVFTKSEGNSRAVLTEENYFRRLRKKVGFDDIRYPSTNRHVITLHAFRSYFLTVCERKQGIQVSGALGGHSPYMKTYYKYSKEERRLIYKQLEPYLTVSSEMKLKLKTESQEKEISELENTKNEITQLKEKMRRIEIRNYVVDAMKQGAIAWSEKNSAKVHPLQIAKTDFGKSRGIDEFVDHLLKEHAGNTNGIKESFANSRIRLVD